MQSQRPTFIVSLVTILLAAPGLAAPEAADWTVPMAGNVFQTQPHPGGNSVQRNGKVAWSNPDAVFSVFFHVNRPANIRLVMQAAARGGRSVIALTSGEQTFQTVVEGSESTGYEIGTIKVSTPGYVRIDLQGIERTGDVFAEIADLILSSDTEDLKIDFVRNNDGGMYYWGRRGPSVHLRYEVPTKKNIRFAYSEITVPQGQDPIGTFYMANGFGQGYFGMQVNSPKERRILFSVWSPFKTDNPRDIPPDQRIVALAKGEGVHVGEFGNEGSGGQSYLVYPWKTGSTCRFLTRVAPDEAGSTVYTAWFSDATNGEWRLIASFRRPSTSTHLSGFHSFLESFSPAHGFIGRRAFFGNIWVCDVSGQWHACTAARFSVDATGRNRHRLDFTGGTDNGRFFLQNCGFFNETGQPGAVFHCLPSAFRQPDVNFDDLPVQ